MFDLVNALMSALRNLPSGGEVSEFRLFGFRDTKMRNKRALKFSKAQ